MDHVNYFKDLFSSIPDYRKLVLLMFLTINDVDLWHECGFLRDDIIRLFLEFENILLEQNEEYLDYTKNEEKSSVERFLNK